MTKSKRCVVLALALVFGVFASTVQAAPGKGKDKGNGKAKDWYVQTLLMVDDGADVFVDDRSGVIGRLEGASDGLDLHDLPLFGSVGSSPGAIVVFTDGGSRHYASDYRSSGAGKQVWTFAVISNRSGAAVTLAWDGLYEITPRSEGGTYDTALNNENNLVKTLTLIDLESGERVPLVERGTAQSYTFTMNPGGVRYFRWVQGDVVDDDLVLNHAVGSVSMSDSGSDTGPSAATSFGVPANGRPPLPVIPLGQVPESSDDPSPIKSER